MQPETDRKELKYANIWGTNSLHADTLSGLSYSLTRISSFLVTSIGEIALL